MAAAASTGPLAGSPSSTSRRSGPRRVAPACWPTTARASSRSGPVPVRRTRPRSSRRSSPTAVTAACAGSSSTSRTTRAGRPSSPWPTAADVVVESFRPGVVDRLGIGYDAVSARNPRIVYCSTSGYGQDGPHAQWAGHDIDYLAVGGYLAMSTPGVEGAPPLPGATVADAAAGGMQAALAITAALAGRADSGRGTYLDVVGGRRRALADVARRSTSTSRSAATSDPGHDILSGRYACYATYRAGDGKWVAVGAIEPKFFANLCAALGCPELAGAQLDDEAQPAIRAAFAAAFATRSRDEWVDALGRSRHLRGSGPRGRRGCRPPAVLGPRRGRHRARTRREGRAAAAGTPAGRHGAATPRPVSLPDMAQTDTEHLLKEAGVDGETVARWVSRRVVA